MNIEIFCSESIICCFLKVLSLQKLLFTKYTRAQSLSTLFNSSIVLQSTRLTYLTHLFNFASSHEAIYLYTNCCSHILAFSHLCESKTSFLEAYFQNFNLESLWFYLIKSLFSSSVIDISIYLWVWSVWETVHVINMIIFL